MNDHNIILVVGDLGAGTNLIKNILLLSEDIDWPFKPNVGRLEFIKQNAYPDSLKTNIQTWLEYEYKLRRFNQCYGVDVSDNYQDLSTEKTINISQSKKIVFLTHWPDIAVKLKKQYKNIKILSLYAESEFALCWQINSYIDKKGINDLHNFSFEQDQEANKAQYIATHGLDAYHKFNVQNMFDILRQRAHQYKNLPAHTMPIGSLMANNTTWIGAIADYLNINLNVSQATDLLNTWQLLQLPADRLCQSEYINSLSKLQHEKN